MIRLHELKIGFFSILLFTGFSCTKSVKKNNISGKQIELYVEAETFNDRKGTTLVDDMDDDGTYVTVEGQGWLAFDIFIPVSGKYRIEIKSVPEDNMYAEFWLEDHVDSEEDWQYDITGILRCERSADLTPYTFLVKDGSPLRQGNHKMRLHFKGGKASLDWLSFKLLKSHGDTPELLTQPMNGNQWSLAWSDEFETEGLPDSLWWTYDIGNWGWGNNELQYYTEKSGENVRIENGNLIIEAKKDSLLNWTSARLTTREKVSFLYGKIEFRAIVPIQRGIRVAGWTLGDKYIDELSWPYCGEMDILETIGFEYDPKSNIGIAHASAHCGAYNYKQGDQPTGVTEIEKVSGTFHTYSLVWELNKITGYIDERLYFEYINDGTENSWPFDQPQNIIFNLAIGGDWAGTQGIAEDMHRPQFIIDYVRVYAKT